MARESAPNIQYPLPLIPTIVVPVLVKCVGYCDTVASTLFLLLSSSCGSMTLGGSHLQAKSSGLVNLGDDDDDNPNDENSV